MRLGANIYAFDIALFILAMAYVFTNNVIQKRIFFLAASCFFLSLRITLFEPISEEETINWFGTFLLITTSTIGGVVICKGNLHRAYLLAAGVFCGFALGNILGFSDVHYTSRFNLPDRVLYTAPLPIFLLAIYLYPRSKILAVVAITVSAALSISTGDRGRTIAFVFTLMAIFAWAFRVQSKKSEFDLFRTFKVVILALAIPFALFFAMGFIAESGILPPSTSEKLVKQSSYGWHFIFSARPDIPGLVQAIFDRPIIGHGSEGPQGITSQNYLFSNPIIYELAGSRIDSYRERGLVLHSGLLGAWVRFGLFGSIFWALLIIWATKALAVYHRLNAETSIIVIYSATALIFIAFFEPGRNRLDISMNAIVVLTALSNYDFRHAAHRTKGRPQKHCDSFLSHKTNQEDTRQHGG